MMSRSAALLLALSAAGCTAGTGGPDEVGYVLLDRDARAAGRLAQDTWEGAPVLPVALDPAEPVAFSSPAGRTVFTLRPGALAYVHGVGGAVEWLHVGADIGEDRLRVYGTREAAMDLARRVAGRVEGGGEGRWTIEAPAILDRTSFLKVPEGIAEIAPEPVIGGRAVGAPAGSGIGTLVADALPGVGDGARQAMLVGVYTLGASALVLDADGGFSLENACSGDVITRGRYALDGDGVRLAGETGTTVLAWEGGALRDAAGERFTPLITPAPESAPAPENAPDADAAEAGGAP